MISETLCLSLAYFHAPNIFFKQTLSKSILHVKMSAINNHFSILCSRCTNKLDTFAHGSGNAPSQNCMYYPALHQALHTFTKTQQRPSLRQMDLSDIDDYDFNIVQTEIHRADGKITKNIKLKVKKSINIQGGF